MRSRNSEVAKRTLKSKHSTQGRTDVERGGRLLRIRSPQRRWTSAAHWMRKKVAGSLGPERPQAAKTPTHQGARGWGWAVRTQGAHGKVPRPGLGPEAH